MLLIACCAVAASLYHCKSTYPTTWSWVAGVGGNTGSQLLLLVCCGMRLHGVWNGSQRGLAALTSVSPSGCLCLPTGHMEFPAEPAVAQPAAGHTVQGWEPHHNCPRLYTAEEPPHTWDCSTGKAWFFDYKGGSNAIPICLLDCLWAER